MHTKHHPPPHDHNDDGTALHSALCAHFIPFVSICSLPRTYIFASASHTLFSTTMLLLLLSCPSGRLHFLIRAAMCRCVVVAPQHDVAPHHHTFDVMSHKHTNTCTYTHHTTATRHPTVFGRRQQSTTDAGESRLYSPTMC